jgi:hypothetical protein
LRALLPGFSLGLALLVLAGCGSSSNSSYPSLGSQSTKEGEGSVPAGWVSLSGNTYGAGTTVAQVSANTANPRALRLQVTAAPDVQTQTSYEVHCDTMSTVGPKVVATTPIQREIKIPSGASSGNVECSVTATATKPSSSSMTVAVLTRPTAGG